MASVNKVILIGNLGADPETRYLPSGDAVTSIRIATTEAWKDKNGDRQEHTEWHRISFFGRRAEVAGEYLKKGDPVYIEGRIRTRKWQDKEGNDKYSTEIICDQMQFLAQRKQSADRESAGSEHQKKPPPATRPGSFDDMDDDIPF